MEKKIKHLVVDTTAFIKATNLRDVAENVYTIQEVVDEITNHRQRRKLVVLPYDLVIKNVFPEHIKVVTDFAIKTGDYRSLSATDIKVMALTYQLETQEVGSEHLKTTPSMQKFVKVTGLGGGNKSNTDKKGQGLEVKPSEDNSENVIISESKIEQNQTSDTEAIKSKDSDIDSTQSSVEVETTNVNLEIEGDDELTEEVMKQINNMNMKDDEVLEKISNEESCSEEESTDDSDDGEWITPVNIKEKKREIEQGDYFEDKSVEVACITSDFAMQNVLKHIGLNVTSVDGRIIRQLRTFIFRCTTCFKTTSVMTKLFCPKCGHATLKKVGVSVDEEGNQHIHINGRKPLTGRGKRFNLPTPRGGQHFQYPILTEDQHIHKRFATRLGRTINNPLHPDYIAGFSPFVMHDVNSRSSLLGIRANNQDIKYWMKHHSNGKKKN